MKLQCLYWRFFIRTPLYLLWQIYCRAIKRIWLVSPVICDRIHWN